MNNSLTTKIGKLLRLNNNKANDEISLTSRFYLENSISGKEVEEFYEQIIKKYLFISILKNLNNY